MCRWKRHKREGRLEFEVHSEWMRRTRRIGQMRPADAEGSKARQGVWVLGPGSGVQSLLLPGQAACGTVGVGTGGKGGQVGRLGIRWGHLDQSTRSAPRYTVLRRVASDSVMRCRDTALPLSNLIESINCDGMDRHDRIVIHLWFWTVRVVLPPRFRHPNSW